MKPLLTLFAGLALALAAGQAAAQAAAKPAKPAKPAVVAAAPAGEDIATPALEPENTLERCLDGIDNDGDGYVDCDDQDCWIFAICVRQQAAPAPLMAPPPPLHYVAVVPVATAPGPERGHQCKDGIDNNNDGLTDCFEPSCQRSRYCRAKMYYVPEPEDKAPGLLLSLGMGLALPNFRRPSVTVDSRRWNEEIPYDPDVGMMVAFDLGYMPLPWFGLGARFMGGGTGASNRVGFDAYEDTYKYSGFKGFAHAGGFLRFQYPAGRFVPYLEVAGGYTYAKFHWDIFDGRERWSDIEDYGYWDDDGRYLYYSSDRHTHTTRHFTMALAPGADFFLRSRSIAVGVKLWLPVFALPYGESSTDNVGVMFNVTYLPFWRERPTLRPEYEQALAAQREAAAAPGPAPAPAAAPGRVEISPVEWELEPPEVEAEPVPEPAPLPAS